MTGSTVGTPALSLISLDDLALAASSRAAFFITAALLSSSELSRLNASATFLITVNGDVWVINNAVIMMRTTYIKAAMPGSTMALIARLAVSPMNPPAFGRADVFNRPNKPDNHTTSRMAANFIASGNRLFSARKISTAIYISKIGSPYIA